MTATGNSTTLCPAPFIAELSIEDGDGYILGRWCEDLVVGNETVSCCFPCPITDWVYSDDFTTDMVPWIGLCVLILIVIPILTYFVLPSRTTQRHYLKTSPLMGFVFMSVAFVVPLGTTARHCHDSITPNNWLSNTSCAVSGSLLLYGAWVLIIGCFFRSISLYVQLCWDIEPGKTFRIVALGCIFVGSLVMLGIALGLSGVSYQVGDVCYISYPRSIGSFWTPLFAVAFVSFMIQLYIMGYCVCGVLTTGITAGLSIFKRSESPDGMISRAEAARETSSRIWRILNLQWRAIAIACLILSFVVFLGQAVLRFRSPAEYSVQDLAPWVHCLIRANGDASACLGYTNWIGSNETTSMIALCLLASGGLFGMACAVRWPMILACFDLAKEKKDLLLHTWRERQSRERPPDLERISSHNHSLGGVSSPTTLSKIDRMSALSV
ncbi:hypothetical protein P175DRAFT_0217589 [Aspergillus ochraceoroseus IBT 24754]|uniref:G-protein coupled receptors family 2 profile 2 domain-containing protein n=3 Tax=Aspergillus subgen. Nidulantes TaxID=2720870 RepID=A0A0F8UPV0_9EURO|nr:uncharacterized protein P175DRAFT_0217589 [Aspergillus ochraceoroseus IBT 24754]KKK21523.1 hypothetical protein ARAM_005042 [Aspergillus rambellii]KKK22194.1 hypothetical protein AOCH_001488 [Aspergillus ochraceoroseus]PTU20481.1 hypothetical protein P175DRAFT_0217589 [Aspergillus ochraceoroseus IBT 24754]